MNKSTASSYALWSSSMHAMYKVSCDKCHGGKPQETSKEKAHEGVLPASNPESSTHRTNLPETCGKCHEAELKEFKDSSHFIKLSQEDNVIPAPACGTCHQAHSVRVLKPSEIEDFCSNCHNTITGIPPNVPAEAKNALTNVGELKTSVARASSALNSAKEAGKDITAAEADLDSARVVLKDVPSVWHRFNLTYFEKEVQDGIRLARNSENETGLKTTTPVTPKTPGFGITVFLAGLFIAYLLRTKRF